MSAVIVINPFGGNGGSEFSIITPTSIGLSTGSEVDQIRINDTVHGGKGGGDRGSIILTSDEYISSVKIRSGKRIDYVQFTTNFGNSIGARYKLVSEPADVANPMARLPTRVPEFCLSTRILAPLIAIIEPPPPTEAPLRLT